MVGFNNVGFDYPIIHLLLSNPHAGVGDLYAKAQAIIEGDRFAHTIWPRDRYIPQIDLFLIHHFNNKARGTSLKALQFNMRSPSVEDLPFTPGTLIQPNQIDTLIRYNQHDVSETKKFWHLSADQVAFRRELTARYGRDFMNHNDTKIGKDYFIMQLEKARPGSCFTSNPRAPIQTHRDHIAIRDIILPVIRFDHPEFQRVLAWFNDQVITDTRGVFKDLSCRIDGFQFDFGTGGIHGSVTRRLFDSTDTHMIVDLDVTGFYPAIAISNGLYPEHLGELFTAIYADVVAQRRNHPKGTVENGMLKLAANGVYGDSNNIYSPFYDPQYTMSITINGQLLLCMLAERLMMQRA